VFGGSAVWSSFIFVDMIGEALDVHTTTELTIAFLGIR
jgi:hypothetical protein